MDSHLGSMDFVESFLDVEAYLGGLRVDVGASNPIVAWVYLEQPTNQSSNLVVIHYRLGDPKCYVL